MRKALDGTPARQRVDPTIWVLAAIAFVPALAFLLWVRARERHGREPLPAVLGIFAYGATLGVLFAIVLSLSLDSALAGGSILVAAVIIAPVVEESVKALGLRLVRRHIDEVEDGLVYGIAVGVGFAATESLLYGLLELQDGTQATAMGLVAARNLSSVLLHAGSSAVIGYAYALHRVRGATWGSVLVAYGLAVALHALYNGLVLVADWIGFLAAIILVSTVMGVLLRKVRDLDAAPASARP